MGSDVHVVAIAGIMIPIVGTIMIGVVAIAFFIFRARERARLYDTVKSLAAADNPSQERLLSALIEATTPPPDRDLRMAILFFAATAGFWALGFTIDLMDLEDGYRVIWPLVAVGLFSLAIGIGRLILWRMIVKRGES